MSMHRRRTMTAIQKQPSSTELKTRIQRHYDVAAPLYRRLWGLHIHHGSWPDGTETKEAAQEQLVKLLAANADIRNGSRILDVGGGFGSSASYLPQHARARVIGINTAHAQVAVVN